MELPILMLTPLPESAVKLVTQFLRKPHPCAVLIKQLDFDWSTMSRVDGTLCEYTLVVQDEITDRVYRFSHRLTGEPVSSFQYRPPGEPLHLYRSIRTPIMVDVGPSMDDDGDDDDDDEDDDYHVDCPGCSNCLGY